MFLKLYSMNTQNNMEVLNVFPLPTFTIQALQYGIKVNTTHCLFQNAKARGGDWAHWLILVLLYHSVATDGLKIWMQSRRERDSLEVCPMLQQCVDTVHSKKLPNPTTASFDTTEAVRQDLLISGSSWLYTGPSAPSWQTNNRWTRVASS